VVLVTDGTEAAAVTVRGIDRVEVSELRRQKLDWSAGFQVTQWNGRPAFLVSTSAARLRDDLAPPRALFYLATHEGFHAYVQGTHSIDTVWPSLRPTTSGPDSRDTEYPLRAAPRYYRAMAYNALLAAHRNPGERPTQLAAAAYWAGRWEQEFSDEAQRLITTDIAEGTAEYVAQAALAMAAGRQDLSADMGFTEGLLMADGESYLLGPAAGLLADEQGLDWKAAMATERRTPLSRLLAGVTPTPQPDSPRLRAAIEAQIKKRNKELKPQIGLAVLDYEQNPALLVIDSEAGGDQALTQAGFYRTAAVPYTIILGCSMKVGSLVIDDRTVFTAIIGGRRLYLVPFKPDGQLNIDHVDFTETGLTGHVTVKPGPDLPGKRTYQLG
jgi:hypothetical protein